MHRCAAGIAHPHAHRIALRPAERPVVAHVLAGTRLDRRPEARVEHAVRAKGAHAGVGVGEHVAHDECRTRVDRLAGGLGGLGIRCLGGCRLQRNIRPAAAVGQRAIAVGEVQQRHLGTAQREAVAVVAAGLAQWQAQREQLFVKTVGAHHHQGAHRGHVERRGQCRARRDPALEMPVVILRNIEAVGGGNVGRRILDQRCRRESFFRDCLGIQKRLERGAGLTPGQDAIDLLRLTQHARRTDPRQHLARGVVEHHDRAVFHIAIPQLAQVARERFDRQALQRRADGGANLQCLFLHLFLRLVGGLVLRAHLGEQLPGKMRRDPLVGIERAALQRAGREQIERIATRGLRLAHFLKHATGALRHERWLGVGCAHQSGGNRGLAVVQTVRGLVEQRARQRVDPHQLAAKRHQVEIGLENLVLAPAPIEHLRGHRLPDFLHHGASARTLPPVAFQQSGELHGDGAGTARALIPEIAPGRGRHRAPIHATVLKKALVLAQHQGRAQGRRDIRQRNPLAAPHACVGANALNRLALAGEHLGFGGAKVLSHFVECGQRERRGGPQRDQHQATKAHGAEHGRNSCEPKFHKGGERIAVVAPTIAPGGLVPRTHAC